MAVSFSLYGDNERKIRQKISGSLNKMKNALTVAILVVCLKTGSGLLNQKPQDSVTIAGKSTYFNCSTSEPSKPILWYHYATNEVHRETIYQFANFTDYWYPCYRKGRYVVEKNPATGAYNLVIPIVLLSDAGRYLCEVEGDEGVATLTVQVESSPVCVASEICKSYSAAIICIIVIILLIAIGGTISVLWYLRVYRPKKRKQKGNKEADANNTTPNAEASSTEENGHLLRRHTTNDLTTKIEELEAELERERSEAKALENQLQKKNKSSESEIRHLEAKVRDLEQSLYPAGDLDYAEKLTLAHTITTDASKQRQKPINSMTFLGKKLFVSHEYNSVIEVYDSETFQFRSHLTIGGMSHPLDLTSCKIANCFYIIFQKERGSESHIMRRDPKGKLIKGWPTGGEHGRLSTYESNVIVCLSEKQLIKEFNGDGELLHTVSLMPDVGFKHPWHAIKVTSSHFAVCHGAVIDELHRVCIVDVQGNIVKELREWESKQEDGKLNVPICLAADSERSILVADRGNQKIRLLNCHLKLQRNLIIQEMGLDGHPVRILLDEINGRLFVAANTIRSNKKEWKDGRILIFNIR